MPRIKIDISDVNSSKKVKNIQSLIQPINNLHEDKNEGIIKM